MKTNRSTFKRPLGGEEATADWLSSQALYLAGRSHLDGADALALEMERKWGVGRLRLLVTPELREKFDRQRALLNTAIKTGQVADLEREAARMCNAWRALDKAAEQAGAQPISPEVWEVPLGDGRVAAIVREMADARAITADKRRVDVWSLEEVANIINAFPEIAKAKLSFPGAEVTAVRRRINDPLEDFETVNGEEAIPF